MFAEYVFLMALFMPALSEFPIHIESYERDCLDVNCPKGSFKQISQPLKKYHTEKVQCEICAQCTDYGYSVCAQFTLSGLRVHREEIDSTCNCANLVPLGCQIHDNQNFEKKNPNIEIINVCYLSSFRIPPRPLALHHKKQVIATLEQFWLESYWKDFELSNLTFFYEFEVKSPKDCDKYIGNVTTSEGSENSYVCTGFKEIDEIDTTKKTIPNTDEEDYEEDEDIPPEIEFARSIFYGAKTVKLWYTVVVKRPRQLMFLKNEQKIKNISTLISSEILNFDLQPEIYKETDDKVLCQKNNDNAESVALIMPTLSELIIDQESYKSNCINVSCPTGSFLKGSFKQISQSLKQDGIKDVSCTMCSQCTDHGYSVSTKFDLPNLRFERKDNNDSICNCANSIPLGCEIHDNQNLEKKNPNIEIINVCYLSSLRIPPRPLASNQKERVTVTLEQFWLESYWKDFELSNLTFFYEFEVKSPEDCDYIGDVTTNEGCENSYVCTGFKEITMHGNDIIHDHIFMITEDKIDITKKTIPNFSVQIGEEEYNLDEDMPSEIEFDRDLFEDAKTVKLWYTVVVKRPRQLKFLQNGQKIENITSLLSSKVLKFDLQPEIYEGIGEKSYIFDDSDEKTEDKDISLETEFVQNDFSGANPVKLLQSEVDKKTDDKVLCKENNGNTEAVIHYYMLAIIITIVVLIWKMIIHCWQNNSLVKKHLTEMQDNLLKKNVNNFFVEIPKTKIQENKENSIFLFKQLGIRDNKS